MSTSKIVCITGMDGTGKSTLIRSLVQDFPNVPAATVWDAFTRGDSGLQFTSKQAIDDYLCRQSPEARLLFLAHAMKHALDMALMTSPVMLFVNGYFYKYFASELALGVQAQLVKALAEVFPTPDLVLHLELPVHLAAARKIRRSRYECGLHQTPSQESFTAFQQKVKPWWESFKTRDWRRLDATKSPEDLAATSKALISEIV